MKTNACWCSTSRPVWLCMAAAGSAMASLSLLRDARSDLKDLALVHRIDRETSGCLVMAKRRSALRELHERFRDGLSRERTTWRWSFGDWQFGEQLIDAPLHVHHRKTVNGTLWSSGKRRKSRQRHAFRYREPMAATVLLCSPADGQDAPDSRASRSRRSIRSSAMSATVTMTRTELQSEASGLRRLVSARAVDCFAGQTAATTCISRRRWRTRPGGSSWRME